MWLCSSSTTFAGAHFLHHYATSSAHTHTQHYMDKKNTNSNKHFTAYTSEERQAIDKRGI